MHRLRFEAELNALGLVEHEAPIDAGKPTLGFEFDMNYGFNNAVLTALQARGDVDAAVAPKVEFDLVAKTAPRITDHEETDGAGHLADGFTTKRDGPRIEISTTPFSIGKQKVFEALVANIDKFAAELEKSAFAARPDRTITVTDIRGHPVHFKHPRTDPKDYPLVIHAVGSRARKTLRFPGAKTALFASPQATVTLPLGKIGMLIAEIQDSRRGGPDKALTGAPGQRLGLRTDLAVTALNRVRASRKALIGTALSDKSKLSAADFSEALVGFAALLLMYLLTGEIVDPRDRVENFAKGSLPINVKTPFWEIYKSVLTARERLVFDELYGKGATARARFYKLARRGATAADGARRLFPARTHWDLDRFHTSPPTWDMLLDQTTAGTPLVVTKDNTVPKKKHAKGDEILFAPLSSKIELARTTPRIAVELRRIGFAEVGWRRWAGLMKRVRELAIRLNA